MLEDKWRVNNLKKKRTLDRSFWIEPLPLNQEPLRTRIKENILKSIYLIRLILLDAN